MINTELGETIDNKYIEKIIANFITSLFVNGLQNFDKTQVSDNPLSLNRLKDMDNLDSSKMLINKAENSKLSNKSQDAVKFEDYVKNYFDEKFPARRYPTFTKEELTKIWGISRQTLYIYENCNYICRDEKRSRPRRIVYDREAIITANLTHEFLCRKLQPFVNLK